MNKSWKLPAIIFAALTTLLCCICLIVLVSGVVVFRNLNPTAGPIFISQVTATPTVEILRPLDDGTPVVISTDTLETLENTIVPVNDPRELAERLEGKSAIPETLAPPTEPLSIGARETFWGTDTDTAESFQIDATLRYVTDHVYFWIEDGVDYDENDLRNLVDTFEEKIYPTDREFFGSEWTPGVDGDVHLYVLYAHGLGLSVAGYFSSADEYLPQAHEYSNAHEMFFLSADNAGLDEEFTYGVLAHEFQHMIHWYRDRNEETWMNEGFSELAAFLNGYDLGGFDFEYTREPDMQLTYWPGGNADTTPNYGAAFLFLDYFLNRYGEEATQALVAHPNNGMTSMDLVLEDLGIPDPLRGRLPNADDLFQDWVLASYLQSDQIADGRFTYQNYPQAPNPSETESIRNCPADLTTRDVSQYGVDYIRIQCRGDFTLHFEGSTLVPVLPEDPYSGKYAFWSNKGDESDMTLTRRFDLTDATGPLTFSFWTWYDLEEDYDYLYLEASTDGETWEILTTPSGTSDDPSGNSYGWGYNGQSGENGVWIQETIDLSRFAGQQVYLRFEYVTDAAVNGEGLLLDEVSIPEIGYSSGFETGNGGWEADGFVRIENALPQTFRLSLITTQGNETTVAYIPLNGENVADIPLHINSSRDEIILVVSGTTRFTTQPAIYQFNIAP